MIRYFMLMLLIACATKETPNEKRVQFVESPKQVNESFKTRLTKEDKDRLVNVYWDFYAFSLRKSCPDVTYNNYHPGNPGLNLPAIRFAELKPGTQNEDGVVHGGTFDLSTQFDDQQYKSFQIESADFNSKDKGNLASQMSASDKRIVLLRTGKEDSIRYVVCSDQSKDKIFCTDDKLIYQLTNINDVKKLCKLVKSRGKSVSKEKVLDGTIRIMDALKII